MCQLFIDADPTLWENHTRSVRLDGVVTSIRLEKFFWSILTEIAKRDDLSLAQLLSKLYSESIEANHNLQNYTSFLRVCCGRYLSLQKSGHLSADMPLSQVNADYILDQEKNAAYHA